MRLSPANVSDASSEAINIWNTVDARLIIKDKLTVSTKKRSGG